MALTCLSALGVACSGAVDRSEAIATSEGALSLGPGLTGAIGVTPIVSSSTTITGRISVARSAPLRGAGASSTQLVLRDASRNSYVLAVDPSIVASLGGASALAGRQVKATGTLSGKTFTASSVAIDTRVPPPAAFAPAPVATGPTPLKVLTVMCRFRDEAPAAEAPSFFRTAFNGTAPHLGHYFNAVSHGKVALDGSQVLGGADTDWIDMGAVTSSYVDSTGVQTEYLVDTCLANATAGVDGGDRGDLVTAALQQADAVAVVVSHNLIANRVFSITYDLGNFGLEGVRPVAIVPPFNFRQQEGFAKSLGFALGMRESTTGALDPTVDPPADSPWDLMSAGGTCATLDSVFGCVAARPLAAHLDQIGWLGASDKINVASGDQTITLVPPSAASGTRLATVPLSGGRYLAIEQRVPTSGDYDANLPGTGVVVHDVVPNTGDINASPFVAHQDAVLASGGTYSDPTTGASVTVQALGTTQATVHVVHDTPLTVTQTTAGGSYSLDGVSYTGTQTLAARPNSQSQIVLLPSSGFQAVATGCSSFDGSTCTVVMDQPRSVTVSFKTVTHPPPPPPPPNDPGDDPFPPICRHKPWMPQCSPP